MRMSKAKARECLKRQTRLQEDKTMQLTVNTFKTVECSRCGGTGRIASYQHIKAGECFKCHGAGTEQAATVRYMTDSEVLAALEERGFPVLMHTPKGTGDWLADMFTSSEVLNETMLGARLLLAEL
jgi:hypothetical protein